MISNQIKQRTEKNQRRPFTIEERAKHHQEASREQALLLDRLASEALERLEISEQTAQPESERENASAAIRSARHARVMARKILGCSSNENYFTATNLLTVAGEPYDGYGVLAPCRSRLCPWCRTKQAKVNYKRAINFYDSVTLKPEELWQNTTLTMPSLALDCTAAGDILRRAWFLFIRKSYYKKTFGGGIKGIEFKITKSRYHWHVHFFAFGLAINIDELKKHWTNSVQTAFEEARQEFAPGSFDGYCVVHTREVTTRAEAEKICWYITKSNSLENVPEEFLLEVAGVRRWQRMFELIGSSGAEADDNALNEPVDMDSWLENEYPGEDDNAEDELEPLCPLFETNNVCDPADSDALDLDGSCDSDGYENDKAGRNEPEKPLSGREDWRDLVDRFGLEAFFLFLNNREKKQRLFRKAQLIKLHPQAVFKDLSGFIWYSPDKKDYGFADDVPPEYLEDDEDLPQPYIRSVRGAITSYSNSLKGWVKNFFRRIFY